MTDTVLRIEDLSAGYGGAAVLEGLDLELARGRITAIVGANASGKSTLLRAMSRLLRPASGRILLDGRDIHALPPRELARRLGILPQSPIAPEGITVLDLVSRGRHPHQGLFGRWRATDEAAVAEALSLTATEELAERPVEDLSGGQRQRVWIAMALAQQTDVLLLDEPTTFLDINHQVEVLDLLVDLNRSRGTTVVMVLHELNLAARYADRLVAMRAGRLHSQGSPDQIMTQDMLAQVFGLSARVFSDPVTGKAMMMPIGRHGGTVEGNPTP